MKRLFLVSMMLFIWNTATFAQDALTQSCALEKSLKTGGAKSAGVQLTDLMAWNPNVNMEVFNANLEVIHRLKITNTGTFSFGSVGEFYQRFLVIGSAANNSPVYFLLSFEKIGDSSRLTNVNFQTGFKKMLKQQNFFGTPEKVDCS